MFAQAAQKQIDAEDTANEAITRRVLQSLAEQRKAYFDMVNETRTADQQLAQNAHATMDKIVEAVEKKVHVLRNLAEEANRAIESSMKRSMDLTGTLADTKFRFEETHGIHAQDGERREKDYEERANWRSKRNGSCRGRRRPGD